MLQELQEEYAREGIDWSYIEFVDNQDCLELLEGGPANPSMAIFPLIDEACRMPKATHEVSWPTCQRSLLKLLYAIIIQYYLILSTSEDFLVSLTVLS